MVPYRLARPQDIPGAYRVCLLTGDASRDATPLHANPDLLGHVYVGPYLARAPEHALVVADSDGIAGYCLAARDTRAFETWAEGSWWPALRAQYPWTDAPTPDGELIRLLHRPERVPDAIVASYPAHLHINLLDRTRGRGLGRLLIEAQLGLLREAGAPGCHLGVAPDNANAIGFYRHLGFEELMPAAGALLMGIRLR